MFPLRYCSRVAFCLLFAAAASIRGIGQSSAPQAKAPTTLPTVSEQWTGDLDVMLKHRIIRIGVPYSKTLYYTVKGVQYGIAYESGKAFEDYMNRKYPQKNKNIKINAFFMLHRVKRRSQT
jgi:hypothetical protein